MPFTRPLVASLAAALLFTAGITLHALPQLAAAAQNPAPSAPSLTPEQLVTLADEVTKEVEALRGWTFRRPVKKELTPVAQMREFLERQADKSVPAGKMALSQALLRTIGLIPPTSDLRATWMTLLESQVGGFYVPETKTMHLVARPDLPVFVQRVMLAHELTHALDDQYVDLLAMTRSGQNTTEDLELASQAVVEGSATALMVQYMTRQMMAGLIDTRSLQQYADQEAKRSKPFLDAPRYFSAMLGAYICGTQFLARGQMMALVLAPDDKAVGEALLAASKDPPQSTEQVLHPDKYWDAAKRDHPVVVDDGAAAKWLAQPGRWIVYSDTIGEMLTAVLTGPAEATTTLAALQSADGWTNAAAAGWAGDRFYLMADGPTAAAARGSLSHLTGAWVTAWDTPADRDEFVAALPKGSLAAGAGTDTVGDAMAVVYFGLDEADRGRLTARLRKDPLPTTKDGKPWTK